MKKRKTIASKIIIASFGVLLAFTCFHSRIQADDPFGKINVDTENKIGTSSESSVSEKGIPFVNRMIMFASGVAAVALLFVIIINGIKVINNDKGPDALSTATKNIMISIGGMVLAASAFIMTSYTSNVLFGSSTYLLDPVAGLQSQAPTATTSGLTGRLVSFIKSFEDLTHTHIAGDLFDMIKDFTPKSGSEVFGTPKPPASGGLASKSYTEGPQSLVNSVVGLLAGVASVWLLIAIIWNGYKIITSGKPEVLSQSMRNIAFSLAGFLIAVMAYIITSYVVRSLYNNTDILDKPVEQLTN